MKMLSVCMPIAGFTLIVLSVYSWHRNGPETDQDDDQVYLIGVPDFRERVGFSVGCVILILCILAGTIF